MVFISFSFMTAFLTDESDSACEAVVPDEHLGVNKLGRPLHGRDNSQLDHHGTRHLYPDDLSALRISGIRESDEV